MLTLKNCEFNNFNCLCSLCRYRKRQILFALSNKIMKFSLRIVLEKAVISSLIYIICNRLIDLKQATKNDVGLLIYIALILMLYVANEIVIVPQRTIYLDLLHKTISHRNNN